MSLIFGQWPFGKYIFAGNSPNMMPRESDISYEDGQVNVDIYSPAGIKTDAFATGVEGNPLSQIQFELVATGCGACTLNFKKLPKVSNLTYGSRIDIRLFGDHRPWWSGYVLTLPDQGGTQQEFKITAHGYYNALKNVFIFKTYENMEVGDIVKDILLMVETRTGVKYNSSKVYAVGYAITKIVFDGVNAQECLKQLSEFAYDFVYGVDEYQELFFKQRITAINEEARFFVGQHVNEFEPAINVDKLVNWARIKGGNIDDQGESWLATVEDTASQQVYGRREDVWTLPTAYSPDDVKRWGESELSKYKDPVISAKVKGVSIKYPKPNRFWVRKLSTDGKAAIYNLDGELRQYPIAKIKYTINADKGIACDLELGEPIFTLDRYLFDIERVARNNELLQQASNKQLGGV